MMDFKKYLESIGAKPGDKLRFVDYSDKNHTHWNFHSVFCKFKDLYVGEDGYMYSTNHGDKYKHTTNWGFIFEVVGRVEKAEKAEKAEKFESIKFTDYFKKMGFKVGDKLEFVDYVTGRHNHWDFHEGSRDFEVGERGLLMTREGGNTYTLEQNYDFIFKRKVKGISKINKAKIKALEKAIKLLQKEIDKILEE